MSSNRANVLVFFTDQQRWDSMAAHGNPLELTPNLDRAAHHGTHVFNSITCQPVCGPARSCLQTGLYATQTGVFRNGIRLDPDRTPTLAHYFREAGYHTGYIGKWHLGRKSDQEAVIEEDRGGNQEWLGANLLEFCSDAYDCVLFDEEDERVKLPGYRVDAQTDAAIRFIERNHEDPFFLFISYLEPHHQNHVDDYPAPTGYRERYAGRWTPPDLAALPTHPLDRHGNQGSAPLSGGIAQQQLGGYWGMIKRLDEAYGRVLDALQSLGILEDTIVLFTSDHGCHFRTRNGEYKRSCHESSVRVPTVLTGGPFTGGGTVRELVSLVDLPPTLLDGAGLPVPTQMEGRSMLPLLGGRAAGDAAWPDDVFIQISESGAGRAVRTRRWKYAVHRDDVDPSAPGASSYTEAYLYDLAHDPYELRNLMGLDTHRPVCDRMKQRLLERIRAVEGTNPEIVDAAPRPPDGQRRVAPDEIEA